MPPSDTDGKLIDDEDFPWIPLIVGLGSFMFLVGVIVGVSL